MRWLLILTCFWLPLTSAEPLLRTKIVKRNTVYFHLSPEFTKAYVKAPLCLSYPPEINLEDLPPTIVDIPLIMNVIAVVWFSGNEYTIDEMDEDLFYSLVKVKEFFRRFFYNTAWEGDLKPLRLVKNTLPAKRSPAAAAALFTAGLDSTTTVLRHFDEALTLISFNAPHETATQFAKQHGFDLYTLSINVDAFLKLTTLDKASCDISKWFWDTSMGLSWVGASAPFLWAKGIPVLYIPSGFTWDSFIFPDGQTLSQPASPLIDENLSPLGLKVQHDPFTMTRTDKIKFISDFCLERGIPRPQLVVCNNHPKSSTTYSPCHKCVKCLLTMLDIVAIGENIQDYGFTLSDDEFISRFQTSLPILKMRRGGTYAACRDTQNYLKQNLELLPQNRRPFYDWFLSLDLWPSVEERAGRPLRDKPFSWEDYRDLYPGVPY